MSILYLDNCPINRGRGRRLALCFARKRARMIYYFTATGNDQHVAERIAEATGDRLASITECLWNGTCSCVLEDGEGLGFVVPTYFGGLPSVVVEFLEEAERRRRIALCLPGRHVRHGLRRHVVLRLVPAGAQGAVVRRDLRREDARHVDARLRPVERGGSRRHERQGRRADRRDRRGRCRPRSRASAEIHGPVEAGKGHVREVLQDRKRHGPLFGRRRLHVLRPVRAPMPDPRHRSCKGAVRRG